MLALLAALAFGVAAGGLVGAILTGDPLFTIVSSLAFAAATLLGVFGGIRSFNRGLRETSPPVPQVGDLALARVERIRRTGLSVNDQPQCELVITVAPHTRAAYTTVHRQIVDIVALAQLQPGAIIVVRRPDDAVANVLLELDPPEEWARRRDAERMRTGSDRTVPLASEVPAWTSEPQTLAGAQRPTVRPGRWVLRAAVFIAAVALTLAPVYDTIGRSARAIAAGDPTSAGVVLGDRHQEVVDALAAETGGTAFVRIGFYDGYAIAAAPSAPGALTIDTYQYRYDRTEHQGAEPIQPDDPAAALFEADEVDFSRIPDYVATAREQSGVDPESVIVIVDRALVADAAGARPVRVMVLLDSAYEDATVVFDAATGDVVA
jgi:hypothetical protein